LLSVTIFDGRIYFTVREEVAQFKRYSPYSSMKWC
jgi:hypothetical protein